MVALPPSLACSAKLGVGVGGGMLPSHWGGCGGPPPENLCNFEAQRVHFRPLLTYLAACFDC